MRIAFTLAKACTRTSASAQARAWAKAWMGWRRRRAVAGEIVDAWLCEGGCGRPAQQPEVSMQKTQAKVMKMRTTMRVRDDQRLKHYVLVDSVSKFRFTSLPQSFDTECVRADE